MEDKQYKVLLKYYGGIIDDEQAKLFEEELNKECIESKLYDKAGIPMMCLEEFTNNVTLFLNNELVQALMQGILINSSYDVLKKYIIWLWNSSYGKVITKIKPHGEKKLEDVKFGLHISINRNNNIDFRLDGEVSDELKSKCIDKIFDLIKDKDIQPENKLPRDEFATYDWSNNEWNVIDIQSKIREKLEREKKDLDDN